jgi:hypothetical protein
VYEPLPVAAALVVVGTVIAVTGIADVCIVEQVIAARRRRSTMPGATAAGRDHAASEPRERHA